MQISSTRNFFHDLFLRKCENIKTFNTQRRAPPSIMNSINQKLNIIKLRSESFIPYNISIKDYFIFGFTFQKETVGAVLCIV